MYLTCFLFTLATVYLAAFASRFILKLKLYARHLFPYEDALI